MYTAAKARLGIVTGNHLISVSEVCGSNYDIPTGIKGCPIHAGCSRTQIVDVFLLLELSALLSAPNLRHPCLRTFVFFFLFFSFFLFLAFGSLLSGRRQTSNYE